MSTKSAEDLIKEQDTVAEMLNDSSIDRVMAIDMNWNIIAWNKTSELISGISKNNVLGKNLLDTFPQILSDNEMLQAIKMGFEGKKIFLPANMSTFNRHYSENHFIPLKDKKDNVIGVMNIIHDVAHRIKVEKQLQKLNLALEKKYKQLEKANNELATFTSITSHDIKEPLKHVYTSLEFLVKKEGTALSNISKGNIRRMQGSLNKMNLLLDDILAVSSIGSNNEQLSVIDLDRVFEETLIILRDKVIEKKAVVETSKLPSIKGYRHMIEYLFLNLIDNGLKFQQDEHIPKVVISSKPVIPGENEKKELSPEKEYLKISFTDNGIGFEPSDSERIFRLFEKLHNKEYHGSGIGLTVSKKIMEAHDGFIEVESTPGAGSAFHCYFPVNPEE